MSDTQKSFIKGAALLGGMGLICKAIGAVFRIPLANTIGEIGMGNYQLAYPVYALLLVISTAGLPTAISKLVSERVTTGDYGGAHYVFRTARLLLIVIGIVTSAVMALFSRQIAAGMGRESAAIVFVAIAPALFFVSILSAYRGYFQGMQNMAPTAWTQLIEQAGKLCFGLWLAAQWLPYGPEYAAAGALLGVTISEICALAVIMGWYARKHSGFMAMVQASPPVKDRYTRGSTMAAILKIAIPITLGACIMPLVSAIDSAVVIRCLTGIGYTEDAATALFGLLTGYVNPLINMPAALSLALAMSLVPTIASSRASGDDAGVSSKSALGFRLAVLVGLPCAVGFFILSEPILTMLYSSISADSIGTTASLFRIMSFAVLFLTLVQSMTGVLQGLGRVTVPVINLLIGGVVKVILSLVLIPMPDVNIYGAAFSTLLCYAVAAVLDVIAVVRHSKFRLRLMGHVVKPVIATAVMGAAAYFTYQAVCGISNTIAVVGAILVAVVVYGVMLVLVRAITPEDMAFIPGGRKLTRLMTKLGLWKQG